MLPPKQDQKFNAFLKSAITSEAVDEKTTCLIQIAAAMAYGCGP